MKRSDWFREKYQDQQATGYCKDHGESGVFWLFSQGIVNNWKNILQMHTLDERNTFHHVSALVELSKPALLSSYIICICKIFFQLLTIPCEKRQKTPDSP